VNPRRGEEEKTGENSASGTASSYNTPPSMPKNHIAHVENCGRAVCRNRALPGLGVGKVPLGRGLGPGHQSAVRRAATAPGKSASAWAAVLACAMARTCASSAPASRAHCAKRPKSSSTSRAWVLAKP
jgi:hypothetical protein